MASCVIGRWQRGEKCELARLVAAGSERKQQEQQRPGNLLEAKYKAAEQRPPAGQGDVELLYQILAVTPRSKVLLLPTFPSEEHDLKVRRTRFRSRQSQRTTWPTAFCIHGSKF
mmetsp:Transcript_12577/g.27586  ORF Transcript_12577/g.27586 Transcript_12577/m.27586 type:complete len:114 (+) Transcript_12577:63-404(+)